LAIVTAADGSLDSSTMIGAEPAAVRSSAAVGASSSAFLPSSMEAATRVVVGRQ
jgi:hypothetical protein